MDPEKPAKNTSRRCSDPDAATPLTFALRRL